MRCPGSGGLASLPSAAACVSGRSPTCTSHYTGHHALQFCASRYKEKAPPQRNTPSRVLTMAPTKPCIFFQQGRCRNGVSCSFSHTAVAVPLAIRPRLTGAGAGGAPSEGLLVPCRFFQKGFCARGQECGFAHVAAPSNAVAPEVAEVAVKPVRILPWSPLAKLMCGSSRCRPAPARRMSASWARR